ncbi:nitroreductase family protein [Yersinia wautersii]|uniref:nitroreductase family protein n=1 Tax=Yersinia wautersii TaxID=1341643 RepID=UPI0004020BC3|nr:nitroreductase family protein [Yersinia wautersii]
MIINTIGKIKSIGRVLFSLISYSYDLFRYVKYNSWRININDKVEREYYLIKVYHSLEKSLSFSVRNGNSGWSNAFLLLEIIKKIEKKTISFHEQKSIEVLYKFISSEDNLQTDNAKIIAQELMSLGFEKPNLIGVGSIDITRPEILKGLLKDPHLFFYSRFSVREFSDENVSNEKIKKAVLLSLKTPSACNRQPWFTYSISEKNKIKEYLRFQCGNKGFTDKINNLLIICIDQKAFNSANERYQHHIDGGMYAMSLIYALHSIGIASCCLNWSKSGIDDYKFRRHFKNTIKSNYSIVMFLAIGYPKEKNKLCVSPRRNVTDVIEFI